MVRVKHIKIFNLGIQGSGFKCQHWPKLESKQITSHLSIYVGLNRSKENVRVSRVSLTKSPSTKPLASMLRRFLLWNARHWWCPKPPTLCTKADRLTPLAICIPFIDSHRQNHCEWATLAHGRREQKLSMNESGIHFRSTAGIQRANTNPNIL